MKLQCAGCGTLLEIGPDVTTFTCAKCGAPQRVEKQGGIVSVKKLDVPPSQVAANRLVQAAQRPQPGMPLAAKIILGLFAVLIGLFLFGTYGPPSKEVKVANESDARYMCEQMVEKRLNDPSSAEWIDKYHWPTTKDAPQEFTVLMQFRAKNGFGGLVLKRATCKVRSQTETGIGNWTLLDYREF
jgi:hypothetical protein